MLRVLWAWAALLAAQPVAANAQSDTDFYKGRTVTLVVGFAPGGSYDAYARLLGRHIGRHIPGQPNVIVQNMPGAGSLTAVRNLDANAPKDGTVIAAFNAGLITDSLTDPEKFNFKFSDLAWIGSSTQDFSVCYAGTGPASSRSPTPRSEPNSSSAVPPRAPRPISTAQSSRRSSRST